MSGLLYPISKASHQHEESNTMVNNATMQNFDKKLLMLRFKTLNIFWLLNKILLIIYAVWPLQSSNYYLNSSWESRETPLKYIARNNARCAGIKQNNKYLWYPLSSPAFRIMPETITPARGSRNLTPRIEPPKVEMNNTRSASFHKTEEHQVFEENL